MTRPVQVHGLLQGLDPTTLKSITVKLDGVAATREITKPFARSSKASVDAESSRAAADFAPESAGSKASVHAESTRVAEGTGASAVSGSSRASAVSRASVSYYVDCTLTDALTADWSTLFRLLGIDPAMKQTLRITVEYKSPSAPAYTYEADVTTLLAGFNTGPATQPAVLNVTLSFGIDSVTGTITGWTPGWDEEVPGS